MKLNLKLLASVALAGATGGTASAAPAGAPLGAPLGAPISAMSGAGIGAIPNPAFRPAVGAATAQAERVQTPFGTEHAFQEISNIQIMNHENVSLGRITDMAIDLVNGRIVEVLVITDKSFGLDQKIVAVPPMALVSDPVVGVYRMNVSADVFRSAPAVDLSRWVDRGRSQEVAAAYRYFGHDPYFQEQAGTPDPAATPPRMTLGFLERASKIQDMPVENLQNEHFGKVWTLSFDITAGRILNVIVLAPGDLATKTVILPTALSFNAKRDTLLLDATKMQYRDEPRYAFTEAAYGQKAYSQEQSNQGPQPALALEQGQGYRDIDRTVRINQDIRDAKVAGQEVQVATVDGRVTLRGRVNSEEDKRRIGEIAIAASRVELVDNQIRVEVANPNN